LKNTGFFNQEQYNYQKGAAHGTAMVLDAEWAEEWPRWHRRVERTRKVGTAEAHGHDLAGGIA
jgi:hypothetical protein